MTLVVTCIRKGLILAVSGMVVATLSACDQLGIDTPEKVAQRKGAEAKAVGAACRHAMRAIEDCYLLNPKAEKAAVFDGWREMDEYMRENKLEGVAPVVPRSGVPAKASPAVVKPESVSEDNDGVASSAKQGGSSSE